MWAIAITTAEAGKLQALAVGRIKGWKGLWDSTGETNRLGNSPQPRVAQRALAGAEERLGLPF